MLSSSQMKESTYLDSFPTSPKFSARLYPSSKTIFNRAADAKGIVTQNIFVRRGLGREPQQAEKYTRSAAAVISIMKSAKGKILL